MHIRDLFVFKLNNHKMANTIERSHISVDMINTSFSDDVLQYTAGVLDTEGCFQVCGNKNSYFVKVSVSQSAKGYKMLHFLHDHFGGIILKQLDETETTQAAYCWYLICQPAIDFSKRLEPYMYLKKREAQVILPYPTQHIRIIPIQAENIDTGESLTFETLKACNLYFESKSITVKPFGDVKYKNWKIRKLLSSTDVAKILEKRIEIKNKLIEFKKQEHDHIPLETILPIAYVGGFIDGDGCLDTVGKNSHHHNVIQKYRTILDVFVKMFGGVVQWRKSAKNFTWDIHVFADEFLRKISPYVFGKRDQVDLILNMVPGTAQQVHAELNKLKGNYYGSTSKIKRIEDGNLRVYKKPQKEIPRGVHKIANGNYIAKIRRNKIEYSLGTFKTIDEAQEVYNTIKKQVIAEDNGGPKVDLEQFRKKQSNTIALQ
jgi:hypothetical protein